MAGFWAIDDESNSVHTVLPQLVTDERGCQNMSSELARQQSGHSLSRHPTILTRSHQKRPTKMSASTDTLFSTTSPLTTFLCSIPDPSTLYIDLEGNNLCRHGTLCLITIPVHPQGLIRVVDVLTLGELAFSTPSEDGLSDAKSPRYG